MAGMAFHTRAARIRTRATKGKKATPRRARGMSLSARHHGDAGPEGDPPPGPDPPGWAGGAVPAPVGPPVWAWGGDVACLSRVRPLRLVSGHRRRLGHHRRAVVGGHGRRDLALWAL